MDPMQLVTQKRLEQGKIMTTVEPKWSESRCAQYEFSLEIEASRERVWRGLTDQIGAWWLPDFHMLGPIRW